MQRPQVGEMVIVGKFELGVVVEVRGPVMGVVESAEQEVTGVAAQYGGGLVSAQRLRFDVAVGANDDPRPGHDDVAVLANLTVDAGMERLEHRRQPVSSWPKEPTTQHRGPWRADDHGATRVSATPLDHPRGNTISERGPDRRLYHRGVSAIRSGLCSVTFRDLTPDAILDLATKAGIAGIEWGADVHVKPGDLDTAHAVADRSVAAGVACASYGTYLGARSPITDAAEVESACATAAALGTTNLRVWPMLGAPSLIDDDERAAITAGITIAAAVAADHGMTVGLEYHTKTLTDSATSTLRLLDEVSATNLFTYWQPNWWTDSGDDVASRLADLAEISGALSHLHVYSWDSSGERFALGEGAELWPAALSAVDATPSNWSEPRYAFMEFVANNDPAQFSRDAATLLSWLTD